MPELVLTSMSGPDDGSVLRFAEHMDVTFGRGQGSSISLLADPEVSRRHGRLFWSKGAWWLEDLGSANGIFLHEFARSQKILTPVKLSPGDIFRIGRSRFRIEPPFGTAGSRQAAKATAT